jgi:hypothetical protein
MYLSKITYEIKTNTLEATWVENVFDENNMLVAIRPVKNRNYSQEQKNEFEADVDEASKYITMAKW